MAFLPGDAGSQPVRPPAAAPVAHNPGGDVQSGGYNFAPAHAYNASHPSGGFLGGLSHIGAAVGNTVGHAMGAPVPQGQPMLRYHPTTGVTAPPGGLAAAAKLLQMGAGPWNAPTPYNRITGLGGTPAQLKAANDWKQAFESKGPSINPDVANVIAGMHDYANAKAPISNNVQYAQQLKQVSDLQHESGVSDFVSNVANFLSGGHSIAGPAAGAVAGGAITPGAVGTFKNLATDVGNLPSNLVQGTAALAPGIWHDLVHPGQPSTLLPLVGKMAQNDPLVNLVQGNFAKAGQLAQQHPLNAILDATGAYGLAGRTAGGLARLGGVDAANLARTRQLIPGLPSTTDVTPYSRNAFTQMGQKFVENHPGLQGTLHDMLQTSPTSKLNFGDRNYAVTGDLAKLKKEVALIVGPERSQYVRDYHNVTDGMKGVKPKSTEAAIAQHVVSFGGGPENLATTLARYQNIRAGLDGPKPTGAYLNTLNTHIANLEAAVAKHDAGKLNLPALQNVADKYSTLQAPIEAQKAALDMMAPEQLSRATEKQFALGGGVPGAKWMPYTTTHPDTIAEQMVAQEHASAAEAQLKDALKQQSYDAGAHTAAGRTLTITKRGLPNHPITDSLSSTVDAMRGAVKYTSDATKQANAEAVAAATHNLDDARATLASTKRNPKQIGGLVREDPNAREITAGPWKGMKVRELPSAEIQAHMGDQTIAHVHQINPDRPVPRELGATSHTPAQITSEYTGEAARTGDTRPGWSGLVGSQVHDVRTVAERRLNQHLFDSLGTADENGQYFTPQTWGPALSKWNDEHPHLPVEAVPNPRNSEQFKLIPQVQMDEAAHQAALEHPSAGVRLNLKITRGARNTMLPFSSHLPVMHTVESVTRAGRAGATPMSYRLYKNTTASLAPEDAARINDLATPGGMAGHLSRMNEEDIGRFAPSDQSVLRRAASGVGDLSALTAKGIIKFQRMTEKPAQAAATGVDMRRILQEQGMPWYKAMFATKPTPELTKALSTEPYQTRLANFSHDTMGQYGNFTASQRAGIRNFAMFSPWYANAAKLAYKTLPKDNPITTNVVTSAANANSQKWKAEHAGLYPGMGNYIPIGPGRWLDAAKFTPIGVDQNLLQTGGQMLLPQYSSAIMASLGLDPFGKPFKGPPGSQTGTGTAFSRWNHPGEALLHVASAFAGGQLGPAELIAKSILGHGQTLYNTSMPLLGQVQLKPGTSHTGGGIGAGFLRNLNPFTGVYIKGGSHGISGVTPGSGHLSGGPGSGKLSGVTPGSGHLG